MKLDKKIRDYLRGVGRKGGKSKSPKKAWASRSNGKKGGRPAKEKDLVYKKNRSIAV